MKITLKDMTGVVYAFTLACVVSLIMFEGWLFKMTDVTWAIISGVICSELEMTQVRNIYPNDPGFGRTDALTKIGNQVFGSYLGKPDNYVQANSPVRFPQVWDASWFTARCSELESWCSASGWLESRCSWGRPSRAI